MSTKNQLTVVDILRLSTGYLEEKGIESPRLTAEILLSDVLGCQRIDLYLWFDRPMVEPELSTMRKYLRHRAGGMPVDYITEKSEFYGLPLHVDRRVMVPRPETEVLVEKILALVEGPFTDRGGKEDFLFLDIGTGSGAISLAILDQLPESTAVVTDVSLDALRVAHKNSDSLGLSYRFFPVQGNLFQPIKNQKIFDLIVSNPPYVPEKERDNLPKEVKDHEPSVALFSGDDGLAIIRKVVKGATEFLKADGVLAIEVGDKQGEETASLIDGTPGLSMIAIEKDLNGIERIILARKAGE
jgi:release factor glutamine methyltransferase